MQLAIVRFSRIPPINLSFERTEWASDLILSSTYVVVVVYCTTCEKGSARRPEAAVFYFDRCFLLFSNSTYVGASFRHVMVCVGSGGGIGAHGKIRTRGFDLLRSIERPNASSSILSSTTP